MSQQNIIKPATVTILERTFDSIPVVSGFKNSRISQQESSPTGNRENESTSSRVADSVGGLGMGPILLTVGTGFLALGSYLAFSGLLNFSDGWTAPNKRTLSDMGEAGAMLSVVNLGIYASNPVDQKPSNDTIPITEVDVTVENRES